MKETQYNEQLFAELYDVQPQAIFWAKPVWDHEGQIIDFAFVYCNQEGLNYLNLTREEFNNFSLAHTSRLTDELRQMVLAEMIQVYHTGQKTETDLFNEALNKYARVLRTKLRGGVLTVVQDRTAENRVISRLEEQTKKLQEREQLLDNLMQYSPAGISITKLLRNSHGEVVDGKTIIANKVAEQFLGVPREVFLSKTVAQIDPDILQSPLYQLSLQTLQNGQPFNTQYYFAPTQKWIELSVSRMDGDHLINIFLDISTTKQAELQLQAAAERLQAVFDAAQSGLFTFAPERDAMGEVINFRFVITNPSFAAYVGQTPDVLKGALGSDYFPGYLHNGVFDMYKETYLTGKTLRRDVHYCVDGLDLYLDLMSTKVHDEVLVTFTDYTALKKTGLMLESLVEDLRRSNSALEEFAHAASHDLKEPIRKIRVFSDRLQSQLDGRLSAKEQEMFERMKSATDRMTLLVDDLLSYSHISAKPHEKEDLDLNKKLQVVLSDLEVMIEEKGAVITIDPLPQVAGYGRQLLQLFQNLIGNALKYSKQGVAPQIHIGYNLLPGAAVPLSLTPDQQQQVFHHITVKDNGIGFEQQYADRIFQLFQRLHGRQEYSGTGIGLSIVRKVVDNHKGYTWAEGTPDVGATFHILLPV